MTDEELTSEAVGEPPPAKRKRRRYRKYAKPVCSEAQWQAILDLQQHRCALCDEETTLFHDHSYRTGRMRGALCRQGNCALGMLKDSLTRLKRALAYLANPPAKQLGFGEVEREKENV